MPELWRPERRRTERHTVTFPLHARLDGVSGEELEAARGSKPLAGSFGILYGLMSFLNQCP